MTRMTCNNNSISTSLTAFFATVMVFRFLVPMESQSRSQSSDDISSSNTRCDCSRINLLSKCYSRFLLPKLIDYLCSVPMISAQREKIIPLASGNVLELGIGSGLNLKYYDPEKVTKVTGIDPDDYIWERSCKRRLECPIPVHRIGIGADSKVPIPDDSFDSVVITYTLCSIDDAVGALYEAKRLMKPNGTLYFCEHGKAPDSKTEKLQKRIEPISRVLGGGCCPGKDIIALFKEAGFHIERCEEGYLDPSKPSPHLYNYCGIAKVQ